MGSSPLYMQYKTHKTIALALSSQTGSVIPRLGIHAWTRLHEDQEGGWSANANIRLQNRDNTTLAWETNDTCEFFLSEFRAKAGWGDRSALNCCTSQAWLNLALNFSLGAQQSTHGWICPWLHLSYHHLCGLHIRYVAPELKVDYVQHSESFFSLGLCYFHIS